MQERSYEKPFGQCNQHIRCKSAGQTYVQAPTFQRLPGRRGHATKCERLPFCAEGLRTGPVRRHAETNRQRADEPGVTREGDQPSWYVLGCTTSPERLAGTRSNQNRRTSPAALECHANNRAMDFAAAELTLIRSLRGTSLATVKILREKAGSAEAVNSH
jgi:hypothetical protein